MPYRRNSIAFLLFLFLTGGAALGLQATSREQATATQSDRAPHVPPLIRYTGVLSDGTSQTINLTFAIYKEQQGGQPLWQESQNVELDASGRYSALLGFAS